MPTTCTECGGSGIKDEDICETCMHTGVTPIKGKVALTRKKLFDIEDRVDDCLDKLNDIWEKLNE